MSDSSEGDIRCRSCGKPIANGTFTIRADSNEEGERIRRQLSYIAKGRMQHAACAAKDPKK